MQKFKAIVVNSSEKSMTLMDAENKIYHVNKTSPVLKGQGLNMKDGTIVWVYFTLAGKEEKLMIKQVLLESQDMDEGVDDGIATKKTA